MRDGIAGILDLPCEQRRKPQRVRGALAGDYRQERVGVPAHRAGTIIEGEWNEAMAVVTACYEAMRADCDRIEVAMKIDCREGPGGRFTAKVKSVESKLGRKLHGT